MNTRTHKMYAKYVSKAIQIILICMQIKITTRLIIKYYTNEHTHTVAFEAGLKSYKVLTRESQQSSFLGVVFFWGVS